MYTNELTRETISEGDYNSLPFHRKKDFKRTNNTVTHTVKDDGIDILTTAIIMSSMFSDDTPTESGHSYGGGSFGGGGASGDYSSDSGSSSDGGGSSD